MMAANRKFVPESVTTPSQESSLSAGAETAWDDASHVLEQITDGFIGLDSEWRVKYVNAEAERLNGMRRENMLGRNHWDLFPAAVGTTVYHELLKAAAERVSVDFENYYLPWDRWFHVKAYPTSDGGLSIFFEDITARKTVEAEHAALLQREREAREEAETLNQISHVLSGELDLQKLVQAITDAATRVTGARFGALFYHVLNEDGKGDLVYTLSGAPREAFEKFAQPRNTPLFEPTFRDARIVRSDDILQEPAYGQMSPDHGMPEGHVPVRSYLAVPVVSRTGEVLGGLFFGHPETGIFTARSEHLAIGIAAHAAIAIDNARLFAKAEQELARRRHTEDLLRQSENHFREMIDALPAAIYTTDAEGRLTHFNPAAAELSGRVPELGTDQWCVTWKLFHADGTPLPQDQCPIAAAIREGRINRGLECIAERPDGSHFWFTPYPTPTIDAEGRITGGINMLVDITQRKAAEEALRRSEERFRGVFESSAIGVAILTVEARFVQVNRAFCEITGCREEELQGFDSARLMHPDDLAAMQRVIDQLVSGELPSFALEQRYLRKDGRTIWVDNSVSVMRDAQGRPECLIALVEDITTRKQAEASLREAEEGFRAIVETTPECVKIVASDGALLHMNESGLEMIGASGLDQVIGKSVYELIAPEFKEAFRAFNEKVCSGQKGSLEFDITGLRGQRRQMEAHAAPFAKPDGTVVQLAITRDVTERKTREKAALLLSAIVDSSDDAIISKDLNGIITSWNQSAERLFGYTAAEAIGHSVAALLIPADRQEEEPNILSRLSRGERVDHFETIRRRKDGTLLDISLTISPVRDAQGRIIGASKIARDISDRKRIENAIETLNAQLTSDLAAVTRMQQLSTRLVQAHDIPQLLGEIVDAGIEITAADMGNIQLLDDDVLKIVSHRGFERPFLDFFSNVQEGEAACGKALQRGERIVIEDVAASPVFAGIPEREVMMAAGARAVQSTPLISRSGQVLGVFSTHYREPRRPTERELQLLDVLARQAADLIERKRAEAALLASEGRFRHLADAMPQIVWTARPDGHLDYYNERWYEFTGFSRDSFGDASWEPILHPDDVQRCYEAWYGCVRSGQPYRIEYRFRDRQERRWRWFMGRALPVRDSHGRIVKWFGTSTDIDEQKRVEEELRRANQDLEQFAYSASHDLQEPLRSIKIYGQLLSTRYADKLDGQALEFLEYLRRGASRMEMLVRDLLAYTQVTQLDAPEEPLDANEALRSALEGLSGAIAESHAVITRDTLPAVAVHRTHLQQLFQNLVGNAIKYSSPERSPVVHVGGERKNGSWVFSVRDNGIGIAPEYKEVIFGLFKRLHSCDEYSGTGIGLAICQRIVERYHGRIWVESSPGEGSKLLFEIPIR